jgi:hypothetical protein
MTSYNDIQQVQSQVNSLYEDLHWILLIAGFIIFDMNSDSLLDCKIPNEIMNYSIGISVFVDVNSTYNLFKNLKSISNMTDSDFNFCDPICTLVVFVFLSILVVFVVCSNI